MKQWESQINRLIKEVAMRKAADRGLSKIASVVNSASSTVFRHPQSAYAVDRTTSSVPDSAYLNGSHSYWRPSPYPAEERVPIPMTGGLYSNGPQGYPSHDGFDPDEDEYEDYPPTSSAYNSSGRVTPNSSYAPSGRGTPVGGRRSNAQSMLPEHDHVPGYDRPRARTEDTNGPVMAQWRSTGLPPPLPPPSVPNGLPGPSIRPTTPHSVSTPNYHSDPSHLPGNGWASRPLRSQNSSAKLQASYENSGRAYPNGNGLPPQSRSRSISQPNSYASKTPAPPVPQSVPQSMQWGHPSAGSKRGSGSSQSTGESSDYSPNSSSPITPFGSSESSLGVVRPLRTHHHHYETTSQNPNPHLQLSPPVKVKVHFHEDIFVIQVPRSTEFAELVEKVGKKIRLCGPRRDDGPLRVKYRDEDGDMVSLGSTEDVQMAFEQYRPGGQVTLFVA